VAISALVRLQAENANRGRGVTAGPVQIETALGEAAPAGVTADCHSRRADDRNAPSAPDRPSPGDCWQNCCRAGRHRVESRMSLQGSVRDFDPSDLETLAWPTFGDLTIRSRVEQLAGTDPQNLTAH